MNIAADCADCCTCPTPTVEWDSRSASKVKCGLDYVAGGVCLPNRRFLTLTVTPNPASPCPEVGWTCTDTDAVLVGFGSELQFRSADPATCETYSEYGDFIPCVFFTYTDEYLTSTFMADVVAGLPAWDSDWNDTAGSFANLSTDELTYSIRESRYRLRFKIPLVGSGTCYRISWVERFIPEAGVGIDSVEVYSPGVYRPTVALSAPPAGGTQARAVAVMSATGTVPSIRVTNPGSGYTSAPTVTVQTASGGGTTSTGWTATLTGGQVTAITGGSAGNYLPTLAFSSGGGTGATATCTMDAQGGIATVTIGAAGSGYTSAPTLTITPKVSGTTAATLHLHLGTETARCAVWDGITPPGYDAATPSTYPIIGDGTNPYFELPVPTTDGTTLVANLRAVCDCTACP